MSDLRDQLEQGRRAYRSEAYDGDLGELALSTPAAARRVVRVVGWSLAAAAAIAIAVLLPRDEPETESAVTAATAPAVTTDSPSRRFSLTQSASVERTKEAAERLADARRRRPTPDPPSGLKKRRWATAMAFARPKRPPASPIATSLSPRPQSNPANPAALRKGRSLSTPSVALRSLNDAISLGT